MPGNVWDIQPAPGAPNGGSARGYLRALRMVGNPDQGRADSDEVVFLCIVDARHELPLLPRVGRVRFCYCRFAGPVLHRTRCPGGRPCDCCSPSATRPWMPPTRPPLAAAPRPLALAYAGNPVRPDEAFARFFAPAAARFRHRVAGKWTRTAAWPQVNFTGRCPFPEVDRLYRSALATVLLVPGRYARAGQMTQRLAEAVLGGCLPITPATIAGAATFTPPILHAADGQQVIDCPASPGHRKHNRACSPDRPVPGAPVPVPLSRQMATFDPVLGR